MRNIFKYIPMVTLGQILGTVVGFPLLCFLINIFYFSNKYNDVTELNADVYIKRSVIKEITMPAYDSGKYIGKHLVGHLSYALNAQGDGLSNTLIANTITFFCDKYQKYFIVICFKDYSIDDWENERVSICVNKDEMLNLQYGTKDNPIPILQIKGIDKSIRVNNLDFDKSYMDKFYVYNVIQYLKYRMPKDEFERRFSGNE